MKPPDIGNSPVGRASKGQRLSQKLRDLRRIMAVNHPHQGRDGRSAAEMELDNFEMIHTPDRPERPVLPENVPSEEECRCLILAMQEEEEEKRRRRASGEAEVRPRSQQRPQPLSPRAAERQAGNKERILSSPLTSPTLWKGKEIRIHQPPSLEGNFENPRPAPSPFRFSDTTQHTQAKRFPLSPRPSHVRHISTPVASRSGPTISTPARSPLLPSAPPTASPAYIPHRAPPAIRRGDYFVPEKSLRHPPRTYTAEELPHSRKLQPSPLSNHSDLRAPMLDPVLDHAKAPGPPHIAQQMRLVSPRTLPKEISLRSTETQNASVSSPAKSQRREHFGESADSNASEDDDLTPPASVIGGTITPRSTPTNASRMQVQRAASMESAMGYMRRRIGHESGTYQRPQEKSPEDHLAPEASHIVRIGEVDHPSSRMISGQQIHDKHKSTYSKVVDNESSWADDVLDYYCDDANFTSSIIGTISDTKQSTQQQSASPEEVTFDLRKLIRESLRGISEEWDEAVEEVAEKKQEYEVTPTSPVLSRFPGAI